MTRRFVTGCAACGLSAGVAIGVGIGARLGLDLGLDLALAVGSGSASAAPVNYKIPEETAAFRPGPNLDIVKANCTACHSADYISTQPRGDRFKANFWQAEVTKMIMVYGAPIDAADVDRIVDYLVASY
jgi:hypothetical protein